MSAPSPATEQYNFLPWVRWGIATTLNNADPLTGSLPARGPLSIALSLGDQSGNSLSSGSPPTIAADIYGPGDVTGLVNAEVARTEPLDGTRTFEPDYFAAVDFYTPDLPWLLSPAAPSSDRLRPWIVLIVLAANEVDVLSQPSSTQAGTISVHDPSVLPSLDDSWAWVHTQVAGDLPAKADFLSTYESEWKRFGSRAVCPRHLAPNTSYQAFLVPSFDAGVQAALGQTVNSGGTINPAWSPGGGSGALVLPYFYKFGFTTSSSGDFESLVRSLNRIALPPGVGFRPIDVQNIGAEWAGVGAAAAPSDTVYLGGALSSPAGPPASGAAADPIVTAFQSALTTQIQRTSTWIDAPTSPASDPVVVPPLYGRWYGPAPTLPAGSGWLRDLNLDPVRRGAAGLGSHVVQSQRSQLMAAAWSQFASVEAANALLNQGQMNRGVSVQMMAKHLSTIAPESLMAATAAVHARVRASPHTLRSVVATSPVSPAMLGGAFRRLLRPRGPVRGRQGSAESAPYRILGAINDGSVVAASPPGAPAGMTSIDDVVSKLGGGLGTGSSGWGWLALLILFLGALAVALLVYLFGWGTPYGYIEAGVAAIAVGLAWGLRHTTPGLLPGPPISRLNFASLTASQFASTLPESSFRLTVPPGAYPPPPAAPGVADSADALAFRAASTALGQTFQYTIRPTPAPIALDLQQVRTTLLTRLDPNVTIPLRLSTLITVDPGLAWNPPDPLQPIMAAPTFPQPMYQPLRDWSQDWLLPNVSAIPPNSMTIVAEDHGFIEAYMLGLNQEMGRQLLYHRFPTDQRGTYFRQFWDPLGSPDAVNPPSPDTLYDIPLIPTWPVATPLGKNTNRPGGTGDLVLLVRGDLFLRYPKTVVYMVPAVLDPNAGADSNPPGSLIADVASNEVYPTYRGTLVPDLTFLGFPLSLRGEGAIDPSKWFVVFQQVSKELRFGLEPASTTPPATIVSWAALSWAHFPNGGTLAYASPGIAPTVATPAGDPVNDPGSENDSNNLWGVNSAQIAYICSRRPARVAVLASQLLPPKPS